MLVSPQAQSSTAANLGTGRYRVSAHGEPPKTPGRAMPMWRWRSWSPTDDGKPRSTGMARWCWQWAPGRHCRPNQANTIAFDNRAHSQPVLKRPDHVRPGAKYRVYENAFLTIFHVTSFGARIVAGTRTVIRASRTENTGLRPDCYYRSLYADPGRARWYCQTSTGCGSCAP